MSSLPRKRSYGFVLNKNVCFHMNMGRNDEKIENGTKSLDGQKKGYQLLVTSLPIYPSKLQTFQCLSVMYAIYTINFRLDQK